MIGLPLNTRGLPAGVRRTFPGSRLIGSAVWLVTSSCWSQPASGPSLAACAAIADPAGRLACYDGLAHAQGLTIAGDRGANAAAAGVRPPAHEGAAPSSSVKHFGLPAPRAPESPQPKSVTAKVTALDSGSSGHPRVTLDDNQLWELDALDPLMAPGQRVTISRATFGSYILTTSSGRSYRAHRLR